MLGTLTIEAGATVCLGADAALVIGDASQPESGHLIALGTATDTIRFVSAVDARWREIELDGGGQLAYALLEHAQGAIRAYGNPGGDLVIEHTRIRDIAGSAIDLRYSDLTLRQALIEFAGSGITCYRSDVALDTVRVEDSAGTGLYLSEGPGYTCRLTRAHHVTVTRSGGYPAVLAPGDAILLTSEEGAVDRLLGNAADTLVLSAAGGVLSGEAVIRAALPWRADLGLGLRGTGTLRIEPGVLLILGGQYPMVLGDSVRLLAEGTADRPVVIRRPARTYPVPWPEAYPAMIGGSASGPSRLVHVRVDGVALSSSNGWGGVAGGPLQIDSSTVNGAGVSLRAGGSRLLATSVHGATDTAVILGASGVTMEGSVVRYSGGPGVVVEASDVDLSSCAVSDGGAVGVLVLSGDRVSVHGCNLEGNAGAGVDNRGTAVVDATGNWWGDAGGPLGPSGDGVQGSVTYDPFLGGALDIGPAAASIAISVSADSLLTADTLRYSAVAVDASGATIPFARFRWSVADTGVARLAAPLEEGLVLGRSPGVTTVSVVSETDTVVRATASIRVAAGAPALDWRVEGVRDSSLFRDIWGPVPTALFIVGSVPVTTGTTTYLPGDPAVWRYDGTQFVPQSIPVSHAELSAVWGRSPSDVYVVGDVVDDPIFHKHHGVLLHYDGSSWGIMRTFPDSAVWAVGGTANTVWLTGDSAAWRFDGSGWQVRPLAGVCYEVAVIADDDAFCTGYDSAGERLFHYSHGAWDRESIAARHLAASGDSVYATEWGSEPAVWRSRAGGPWERLPIPDHRFVNAIAADDSGRVYLAGEDGELLFLRGDRWQVMWTDTNLGLERPFGVGGELFVLLWLEPGRQMLHGR